jgi:hypothetical protein
MWWIALIIIVVIVVVFLLANFIAGGAGNLLLKSAKNPYTYYCKKCGQEYDTYGIMGCYHHDTLEAVYPVKNENCECKDKIDGQLVSNLL